MCLYLTDIILRRWSMKENNYKWYEFKDIFVRVPCIYILTDN